MSKKGKKPRYFLMIPLGLLIGVLVHGAIALGNFASMLLGVMAGLVICIALGMAYE